MKRTRRLVLIDAAIGAVLFAIAAVISSLLWNQSPLRFTIPIIFIGFVFLIANRFGRLAGIVGSIASAVIFACFMFQPLGDIHIASDKGRESLNWLLLGGLSLSMLFARGSRKERRDRLQ